MKQSKKRILIAVLALVLVVAIVIVSVLVLGGGSKNVYVYSFDEGVLGMTDFHNDGSESSGIVTTDRVQPTYLTETQKNVEVKVQEGQTVSKGDTLYTYDTTLSEIALQQKDLSVQQLKMDLEAAKKELSVINSYVPFTPRPDPPEPPAPEEPEHPLSGLTDADLEGKDFVVFSGSGESALSSKVCWLRSSAMVDDAMMDALFSGVSQDVVFIHFIQTEGDSANGSVTGEFGLKLMRFAVSDEDALSYSFRYSFFQPTPPDTGDASGSADWVEPEDTSSGYTAAEIAQMRAEKQAEIRELDFKIKVAESELSIMRKEADSGTVTADFDGVVMNILDEETARNENQPLLKVSGGGGFYVTGTASELDLANIQLDQKVTVSSWETGSTYEGTVVEIQKFPVDADMYGGSTNLSYYPFKVFIDESADLQDGFYVSMTLQSGGAQSSLYLDNAFLRTDGATSYVYVRNEEGRLEKRRVQVGAGLWDSYTQILGGITEDDWLAFPYGKNVKEGAKTEEGTMETLYGAGMGGM